MLKHLSSTFLILLTALILAAVSQPANAAIIYVDSSATTGGNTGGSWTDAYTDLQSALGGTLAPGDSIWVAAGTYYPAVSDRNSTFQLVNGVAVVGGFAGGETAVSERDWAANVTILSGDIDKDGIADADNSYRVVFADGVDSTTVLDGFTITGGYADESGVHDYAAGMRNSNSNTTIVNMIFSGNYAYRGGGGMGNTYSDPTIINVVFMGNSTTYTWSGGAGMNNNSSDPTLVNVTFCNNNAGNGVGGGMHSYDSDPVIINTIFWGNTSGGGDEEINNNISYPLVSYSLVEGGLTPGCDDGGGNIDTYPQFVDAIGGDLHLHPTSPAVNSGLNDSIPAGVTTDLDGNPRIAGTAVDMGAYEYPCPSGSVVYVDNNATGANNGSSWTDAFTELREALEWASCDGVTEIWVAGSTYKPTSGTGRDATFQLVNGVAIYGGFAGGETSISQRNWAVNVTTLSGDINTTSDLDNSYHVVTGSGTDATAVLDGFTITKGYVKETGYDRGAGMLNVDGSPTLINLVFSENYAHTAGGGMENDQGSHPTLTNVVFEGNSTGWSGGGGAAIQNTNDSHPTVINATFLGNEATGGHGGAIFNYASDPTLINATFSGNSSAHGGAIYSNDGNPTLINVTLSNNSSTSNGGGIHNRNNSNSTLINVTLTDNHAGFNGGGIYNYNECEPALVNTVMWGNSAGTIGPEIYNASSTPVISYSLIEGCGGSGGGWDGSLGVDSLNNIDADPLFVDAAAGNLRLIPISPAVDAGLNDSIPAGVTTDLDGNPRIVPALGTVDMGAYESQALCPPANILYVDKDAVGEDDGTSWEDAFPELTYALEWVTFCPSVSEIWVAAGTYKPTDGLDRTATFQLLDGIAIFGGFAGSEDSLSQRDVAANVTILSGDIGVEADSTDNCYHVVTANGTEATAVLDGFTITGGNADAPVLASALAQSAARGDYDVKPTRTGGTIAGSRISAALIDTHGGGIYNNGGSPTLANLVLTNNYAVDGGGMYNDGGSPTLLNVTFTGNRGLWGGGIHNYDGSNPTLVNVVLQADSADFGGGMYNNWSNPELVNVTFTGCAAFGGGGIYNTLSNPVLINTILWGDSAQSGGHEIYNVSSIPTVSYSLIAGSGGSGSWDENLGTDGGNNIDADPLFLDGAAGDLRCYPGSPAIDAGDNTAPDVPSTDIDGNTRIVNGAIDIGAYESQSPCVAWPVLYVNENATGANDGSSWTDAFTDLATALFHHNCPGITEIWVAAGTYKPTSGTDREATFQLINGISIFGGFAGGETNLSQRDWAANVTTLSGDIGTVSDYDNSYHVVTGSGTDSTAVLDGFTITQGNADGAGDDNGGGGMITVSGSPTIANVTFTDNAAEFGGGMHNRTASNPTLTNVTFSGNSADHGAGVRNDGASNSIFINVVFSGNSAASHGGGMHNDNGSNPTLINVTFSGNSADYGGGIRNWDNSNPVLVNTILWGNSAGTGGPEIYNDSSTPVISYSLIEGCGGSGAGWDGGLGVDSLNNIDADPLFVDAPAGNLRLLPGSPAVNAGLNDSIPSGVTTDLDGNPRIMNGTVDMGAYEFQATCPPDSILYVDTDATGANDGTSWDDAFTELQYALEWLPVCPGVNEIWVAVGTYKPTSGGERDTTFNLVSGVSIYGGFAGGETSISERDWVTNVAILSGDVGVVADSSDNSYHVVTGSGTDSTAVLDGFTIAAGYADGGGFADYGGGMYNDYGNPTIVNAVFSGNYAYRSGGGMYNYYGNPKLANVVFIDNSTNHASHGGGAMANNTSNPSLVNVTFCQNDASAGVGGAMANFDSYPKIINTIMWGDTSSGGALEINNAGDSDPEISYSLIAGSGGSSSWDNGLGTNGGNNIDADPMFVDALAGDLHLTEGSPAIGAGSNDSIPSGVTTDLDGNPRIVPSYGIVDMGAYEFQDFAIMSAFPSPLCTQAPVSQTTCDTIHVVNNGGAACTIAGIYGCTTAPFSLDTTMTTHTLAAGDTTEIVVCVTPTVAGPDTSEVTIVSDASNGPVTVQVQIFGAPTAVEPDRTPKPFRIVAVTPNPFNPATTVHFTLPAAMPVTAVIYSVTGTRVRVLANKKQFEPGENRLTWDGRTDHGSQASSGVYFIRIETRLGVKVARAVLLK